MVLKMKLRDPVSVIKDRIRDAYIREINAKSRPEAVKVLRELKEVTPKDTGRAASSWSLSEHSAMVLGKPKGKKFVLYNSVPYIKSLNMGHSKQAPPRFIEKTLAKHGLKGGAIT